jgi:toxin ParE1/3/4
MSYRLEIKNRATQDLRLQANYILMNGSVDAAERFLSAAETTFAQLTKNPRMGKVTQLVVPRFGEVRQWRIKDFKEYLILYQVQEDVVEILRVLHGARDLDNLLNEPDED